MNWTGQQFKFVCVWGNKNIKKHQNIDFNLYNNNTNNINADN